MTLQETSKQAVVDNVRKTLATALQVLDHFEQSLLKAGFVEGSQAYRSLAETLLGQRLWATSRSVQLDEEFTRIAKSARSIYELLLPYSETMLKLAAIASLQPAKAEPQAPPPPAPGAAADRVLQLLSQAQRPMSLTALCAATGLAKSEVLSRIAKLEQDGRVARRGNTRVVYTVIRNQPPSGQ